MKRKLRRMASFCMTVVLLLSSVVWAPAAGAEGETISLAEADIHIEDVCYYNGSQQTPKMTVTLHTKVLTEGLDYTTTYQNNVNAGTATVTVTGEGIYSGSASALFTIHPRKVDAEDLKIETCLKSYDGTVEAKPEILLDLKENPIPGDNVIVTYDKAVYETPYVGKQIPITVSGISFAGEDGKNYELKDSNLILYTNGQITTLVPEFKEKVEIAKGYQLDLKEVLLNNWKGEPTFAINTAYKPESILNGSVLTAGDKKETFSINVTSLTGNDVNGDGEDEYAKITYAGITVQIVEQEKQEELTLLVENQPSVAEMGTATVYYGQALQFGVQGDSGTGAVTYKVENSNNMGQAEIDQSGLLSTKEVGTVRVQAQKAGDDRYEGEKWSDPVTVTILPAPLTIQVKDKTARIGDAIPTLTAADYTVTGLVGSDTLAQAPSLTYVSTPDMSKTGAVAIQASGAAIPNGNYDPNITYLPGVLTIQEIPTYTVTVPTAENGTITADKATAQEGDTVTLTVRPAEGYVLQSLTATCAAAAPGTVPLQEKGEGIYTFAMPAGDVTVTGTFALEEEEEEPWPPFPFTDVPETMWYYDSVYYVYAHGLMNGTAATLFSPGNPTTRGMLVTILYRMEGNPQGAGWGPFTDVTPGAYYAQPIAWAAWNSIVNGITSTTFAPDRNVTREQMAAILYRYTAWKGWDVSQQGNLFQFTDWQKVQTYARTPLAWAVASGLIQGKENQRLDPGGPATRAEVATILQRFHSTYVAPPAEEETA